MNKLIKSCENRSLDVVCLGLNACDQLCLIEKYPEKGNKQRIVHRLMSGGGQSATAACCLAKLGYKVAYQGVTGDDRPGDLARYWLEEFGVACLGLVVKKGATSQQAFIMIETKTGERTIFWERDEACVLEPNDLNPDLIASAKVLHLDGHFLDASIEAAKIAKKNNVLVSLDGERVYPGTEKLVSLCDCVVGCCDYAQRLTGKDDPKKALAELSLMGPSWVGRTMGADGATLICADEIIEQKAFSVKTQDTTGAGDVFHAGLIHGILLGYGPYEALKTAQAVAAISVTALGGRTALPDCSELKRFLDDHDI